jgi:hypothetical protein
MSFVGVLMLDTRFDRPPGDIGHAESFAELGIPVIYSVVYKAFAGNVVSSTEHIDIEVFIENALQLVAKGASLITTSCGFLAMHQQVLQAALPVPVFTSALLELSHLPSHATGVLTFDAESLTAAHFEGAGLAPCAAVQGLESGCELRRRILQNEPGLDVEQARQDVVQAAVRLKQRYPQCTNIVLECTNMPPYARDVAAATGCTVHDIWTLLAREWRVLSSGNL